MILAILISVSVIVVMAHDGHKNGGNTRGALPLVGGVLVGAGGQGVVWVGRERGGREAVVLQGLGERGGIGGRGEQEEEQCRERRHG